MTTRLAVLASVLSLGAVLGLQGCAEDRAAIQVQALCYPDEACGGDGGCGALLTGVPVLTGAQLVVLLQVENQLPNNEDLDLGRLNTNDAHVDGTTVEFNDGAAPPSFVRTNGWVPAGSTATVLTWVTVAAGTAPGTKVAQVRLSGYYDDGTRFETGDFAISFEYCPSCAIPTCATGVLCPPGAVAQAPVVCNPATTP